MASYPNHSEKAAEPIDNSNIAQTNSHTEDDSATTSSHENIQHDKEIQNVTSDADDDIDIEAQKV